MTFFVWEMDVVHIYSSIGGAKVNEAIEEKVIFCTGLEKIHEIVVHEKAKKVMSLALHNGTSQASPIFCIDFCEGSRLLNINALEVVA